MDRVLAISDEVLPDGKLGITFTGEAAHSGELQKRHVQGLWRGFWSFVLLVLAAQFVKLRQCGCHLMTGDPLALPAAAAGNLAIGGGPELLTVRSAWCVDRVMAKNGNLIRRVRNQLREAGEDNRQRHSEARCAFAFDR